jgi:CDP-4-dehydro-6-deoxyglucose reductase, E3
MNLDVAQRPAIIGGGTTTPNPAGEGATAVDDLPFMVVERFVRTPRIIELRLAPLDRPLAHLPGQYVLLADADSRIAPRSYSVANPPRADGQIRLLVTEVAGGETSSWAHHLRPAETVLLSGPYGAFLDDPSFRGPVLHMAAGSGLAPILAITESELRRPGRESITLLFSARTPADVYMLGRFALWERVHPGFSFGRTLRAHARHRPAALGSS